jgi:hypothetical protein
MIFKYLSLMKSISKKMIYNAVAAKRRHRRGCDLVHFDWEKVIQEARKFRTVFRPQKDADRIFVFRVLAASQWNLPPWCVWDALEAVKQLDPRIPIAYFRTVLRDNCHKSGVDLDRAIRHIHVPDNLPTPAPTALRSKPTKDEDMRLSQEELLA